jgi:hypothetical protein
MVGGYKQNAAYIDSVHYHTLFNIRIHHPYMQLFADIKIPVDRIVIIIIFCHIQHGKHHNSDKGYRHCRNRKKCALKIVLFSQYSTSRNSPVLL